MTKRGRKPGDWPQRHLRLACERQELAEVQLAVPDTRQRVISLLAVPMLIEMLQRLVDIAREIASIVSVLQIDSQDTSIGRIVTLAEDIVKLAEAAEQVMIGGKG